MYRITASIQIHSHTHTLAVGSGVPGDGDGIAASQPASHMSARLCTRTQTEHVNILAMLAQHMHYDAWDTSLTRRECVRVCVR